MARRVEGVTVVLSWALQGDEVQRWHDVPFDSFLDDVVSEAFLESLTGPGGVAGRGPQGAATPGEAYSGSWAAESAHLSKGRSHLGVHPMWTLHHAAQGNAEMVMAHR